MTQTEIKEAITRNIVSVVGEDYCAGANLSDMCNDSLDKLYIIMRLEDEFGLHFPDELVYDVNSEGEILFIVQKMLGVKQ